MPGFGVTLATAQGPALFALGQAGYALRTDEALVLIDPWPSTLLERNAGITRPAGPALLPDEVEAVDLVCITHPHEDHLDAETLAAIAANVPGARFAAPATDVATVVAAGVPEERITGVRPGEPVEIGRARHRRPRRPPAGPGCVRRLRLLARRRRRAPGARLPARGRRAADLPLGDTVWWAGLEDEIRALAPDFAILPINGRDPLREAENVWGNLLAEEAALLAAAAGVGAVVPCHFDGVAGNLGDPETFVRTLAVHAPLATAHVLHPGDRLDLPAR